MVDFLEKAAARMRKGLELLKENPKARFAFRLANEAMADQRIHSIWAKNNRAEGKRTAIPPLYGALLKNEQDVHLFERLVFLDRKAGGPT